MPLMSETDFLNSREKRPESDSPFSQGSGSLPDPGQISESDFLSSRENPRPLVGQTSSTPKPANSDEPWYEKAWTWANTPLTTSLFGMPEEREGAGGFERGIEHIAAGLTSPLSVALGLATFGTGSVLASAGETALKEATLAGGRAAFTADEIAQIAKGSQAALKAYHSVPDIEPLIQGTLGVGGHDLGLLQKARNFFGPVSHDMELAEPEFQKILSHAGLNPQQIEALGKGAISAEEREALAAANGGFTTPELQELARTGKAIKAVEEGANPVRKAVAEAGVDPDLWARGRDYLHSKGMDEAALLGGDLIDRGAFQVLHHIAPDLSLGTTLKAARTAKTLMNTGFTLQQLEGAAAMSPRFFDALKEGDYDKAAEYGTEWAANAVLGVAGASHALHAWGELAEPILGSKLKPSDEQLRVNRFAGVRDAEGEVGNAEGIGVNKGIIRALGFDPDKILNLSKAERAELDDLLKGLQLTIESGKDPGYAKAYFETLRKAEGTAEPRPVNGLPEGKPIEPTEVPSRAGTEVVFQNEHGEVRVGADGSPVVWMSPEAWSEFEDGIGHRFSGVSYSRTQIDDLVSQLKEDHPLTKPIAELFKAAQERGMSAAVRPGSGVLVVGEELHHALQRRQSSDGEIHNHLDGATKLPNGIIKIAPDSPWARLNGIIPEAAHGYMDALEYPKDPVTRVAETAAKFRAGRIPEGVSREEAAKWLMEYEKEVIAKHGPDAYETAERINEIAKQHVEDVNVRSKRQVYETTGVPDEQADQGINRRSSEGTGSTQGVVPEERGGVRGGTPEGLTAREVQEEPVNFVSPNVYKIGNVSEAEKRLSSRSQKTAEKLSEDLGARLGIKAVVRPSIGHWEGGAENSMISRFAPGSSPDAVEYHNAIMAKARRQNAGISFHPDPKGPDVAFQFRVPSSVADPKTIVRLLEEHHISGSSIEPIAGGHNVIITSPGGELRGPVSEIANRLKATQVKEHNGTQTTLVDWNDRNAASTVYDARIRELEAAHPEWRKIRTEFESSPAYDTLSKLVREAEDKVTAGKEASPFIRDVHGSRTANIDELNPEFQGKGPQGGAEMARAKNFPDDFVKRSYLRLEGSKNEPFYERLPYQYRAVLNSENLYNWVEDRDGLLPKAEKEAAVRKMDTQPGAVGTIYERMMRDAGYDGYYHPGVNQIGVFKNTPVEKAISNGEFGLFSREKKRTWSSLKLLLTDKELKDLDTPEKQQQFVRAVNSTPDRAEWDAAVKAGSSGRLWYERGSGAFDALHESQPQWFKAGDKEKFLQFVAALSPIDPVNIDLLRSINMWVKWHEAGRPMDVKWGNVNKDGFGNQPNSDSKLWTLLTKETRENKAAYKRPAGVDPSVGQAGLFKDNKGAPYVKAGRVSLPGHQLNAVRALMGEPLSGPKVSAFGPNLGEDVTKSTNDTWMAIFTGKNPNELGDLPTYHAITAGVRQAALDNNIPTRQAQAAIWSFVKTLAEASGWGNDRWMPPRRILEEGLLTPDLINSTAYDFSDLLSTDPEIRARIKALGGDLNALDKKLEKYVPERPEAFQVRTQKLVDQLSGSASRLEAARENPRTADKLARKKDFGAEERTQNTDFRPVNGLFSKEPEENLAPQWYLKSNQLVDSRMQGPMPADTALKMLENNGVKPDELKYTGLSDFLKEKGKEPVRPEELRDFLKANNLQITEVTKGGPHQTYGENGETRFESYTLPGAIPGSYRELLMTLPEDARRSSIAKQIQDFHDNPPDGVVRYGPEYNKVIEGLNEKYRALGTTDKFRSSHWPDEINPVGHVRFNDRTGPNGEKLLHLEELQSDWHQKGRKEGYATSNDEARSAFEATKKYAPSVRQAVEEAGIEPNGPDHRSLVSGVNSRIRSGKTVEQAWFLETGTKLNPALSPDVQKYFSASKILEQEGKGRVVPDAPFKKTWPEFLFKRMVRYAAENGYDGISWTPGEEQAARYDLSKQISEVHYSGTNLKAYDHSGGTVFDRTGVAPADLPDIIGKEAAQKLMAQEPKGTLRSLVGQDLKVGGEGMKGFYDKIVPDLANKLGKQFGAKVGETKINAGEGLREKNYTGPEKTIPQLQTVIDNTGSLVRGQLLGVIDDMKRGLPFRDAMLANGSETLAEHLGGKFEFEQNADVRTVPHFPITDSLRESVLKQGQPLFAREGRPVNGLPENLDEMLRDNEFAKKPPEYRASIQKWWQLIAEGKLPEKVLNAYKYATGEDGKNWEIAHRNGMMDDFVENHVHRYYQKNEQGNIVVANAKAGNFATNTTGARRRAYDTLMTALLKSPDEIKFNPAEAISKDRAEIIKAAANRKFISNLMSSGLRASDGRPVAFLNGAGNVQAGENGKDTKVFVDPERTRKINIDDKTIDHLTQSGDLQRFLDDGTIRDITPYVRPDNIGTAIDRLAKEALKSIDYTKYGEQGNNVLLSQIERLKEMQKTGDYSGLKELNDMQSKVYAWSPQGYVALDHSAMRGWNFLANSPDGTQIRVNTDIMAHPEYAQYLKNRLGLEKGALSQSPIGRAVLSAGKTAKETLLSLSPFHMVQIAIRAIQTGINPFSLHGPDIEHGARVNPLDPNSPTKIRKMVEQGMMTGIDYKGQQAFTEGLASGDHSLLRKVPVVGPILADTMSWQTDLLFRRYLPAVKMTAAEKLFDDYRAKYPEWSDDKVARAAGQHASESFGGINWRAMGRNATTSEMARAVLLAPDWLESELRSGARLFNKDEGAIGRRQVVMMAGSLYLLARVLNAVTTGNPHYEAPFSLATKSKDGKETLWGIRTLPTDLLAASSSPGAFIKGRLSPGVGLTQELLSGRDRMGHKMRPNELWADAIRNLFPIPVQSLGQAITNTGPQVGNAGQVWKAVGGTARNYSSPAQQRAAELAATHGPDGYVDPVQQARHRMVQELGDRLRSGDVTWPDLVKMTYGTSQLTEPELKRMQNNFKATQNMPADIAHLYSRASHLPAKEFLDVWDTSNITEQKALQPLLVQAQKRYLRKAAKELTPQQREQDPTFQRLLKMAMGTPGQ